MRPGEVNGDVYDFVSHEQFLQWIKEWDFVEYALVHQKYLYGTRKSRVFEVFAREKYALKEMEINGWEKVVEDPFTRAYCRSIFFNISDDLIEFRLRDRDPTIKEEEIQRRLLSAKKERNLAPQLCDFYFDVSECTRDEQAHLVALALDQIVLESDT